MSVDGESYKMGSKPALVPYPVSRNPKWGELGVGGTVGEDSGGPALEPEGQLCNTYDNPEERRGDFA